MSASLMSPFVVTREEASAPPTFAEVFDAYGPFVVRSLRRLGARSADLDDLTQEVFLLVHRRFHRCDPSSDLRPWLFQIARRVSADHRKRAHVRRELVTDAPPEPEAAYCQVEARDYRRMLGRALATLSEAQREVFVLYELEGLAMAQVAEAVSASLFTCYSRHRVGREKVRAFLARVLDEGKDR